jgi:hypothetical protein
MIDRGDNLKVDISYSSVPDNLLQGRDGNKHNNGHGMAVVAMGGKFIS